MKKKYALAVKKRSRNTSEGSTHRLTEQKKRIANTYFAERPNSLRSDD